MPPILKSLIFIFLIISHYGSSQKWLLDKEDLNGNVKAVYYNSVTFVGENESDWWTEESSKYYNEQGFLTESNTRQVMFGEYIEGVFRIFDEQGEQCLIEYFILNDDTISTSYFDYDSLSRVKKCIFFSRDKHWSTYNYSYNKKGRLDECLVVLEKSKAKIRDVYKYDVFGNKTKHSHTSDNYVVVKTWKYDKHGNIVLEKSELKKAPSTTVVTLNDNGAREVKRVNNFSDDDRNYVISFEYNQINQIIREVKKYLDGRTWYDYAYTYNNRGFVETKTFLNAKCCDDGVMSYTYKYDNMGNWISIIQSGPSALDMEKHREIEYY